MTAIREIITDALEETNDVPVGQTPSAEEMDRGLRLLQGLYDEWVDGALFGRFNDVRITADYTAAEFDRVLNTGSYTVTLPTAIVDDYTGETRPPYDRAMIAVVKASTAREISIYDALTAAWVRVEAVGLDDTAPFANRGAHGLACQLAKRIAGSRVALGAQTENAAAKFIVNLTAKQASPRRETQSSYF